MSAEPATDDIDPTRIDPTRIDGALVAAGFAEIGRHGWARLSIPRAAREAGVPLDVARQRLPGRCALLLRFGGLADAHALHGAAAEGPVRDRLFDIVMRRIDFLQMHRAGVVALLRALPADPIAATMLGAASLRSMAWLLEGAGIGAGGSNGTLRAAGLLAVWTWTVRAWERDTSDDLAATMAALDQALGRAEQAAGWLAARGRVASSSDSASADTPPPADASPHAAGSSPMAQQQEPDHGE